MLQHLVDYFLLLLLFYSLPPKDVPKHAVPTRFSIALMVGVMPLEERSALCLRETLQEA